MAKNKLVAFFNNNDDGFESKNVKNTEWIRKGENQ